MSSTTLDETEQCILIASPLTPKSFSSYGYAISIDHQLEISEVSLANNGTAIKIPKVMSAINDYDKCPSGKKAEANWNIFRCSVQKDFIKDERNNDSIKKYANNMLERHPYTTQTFIPIGQNSNKRAFLVIVAESDYTTEYKAPILKELRAFICNGNQGITYKPGVWHSPMVAIDEDTPYIDFAVFNYENGNKDEDYQEYHFKYNFNIVYRI